jgi:hypothetical protein
MNDKPPSIQEWRDLYNAAIEFKKIDCWNWMWDSDIFGVQNPVTGEIGYCCVMGGVGELFALTVFLDSEGLDGYSKIQSGEFYSFPEDMLNLQKCLTASFEDKKFLQKEDFQLIKKVGLKFSGHNSWPLFRSYRPGYHPWYLTSEEARYLTLCLQQTIGVSLSFKDDSDLLTSPYTENHYLIRVSQKDKIGGLSWEDKWLKPLPLEKGEIIAGPIDMVRLEEIKSELGIKLRSIKRLRMLEDAQASMSKFTAGENRDEI